MILGELPALKKLWKTLSIQNPTACIYISEKYLVVQAFHISPAKNRDSILQYGLKPFSQSTGNISYPPALFISLTVENVPWGYFSSGEVDIWTFCISPKKLRPDTYGPPGKWFYTQETIPFYKLYLHESIEDVYIWGMQTNP